LHYRFLEFLGPDHGHEQIDEQQQRDDSDDNCSHGVLLEVVAKTDIKRAGNEKHDHDSNKDEVAHKF
jgi:hypothetical protein